MLKQNFVLRQEIILFCKTQKNTHISISDLIVLDYLFEVSENKYSNIGEIGIDSFLSTYRGVSRITTYDSLYRSIRLLAKKGVIYFLDRKTDTEAFNLLNRKNSSNGCLFCAKNVKLHNHHYPIRAKDNGTETIKICPKCHFQFHKITDYELKVKINWDFIGCSAKAYREGETNV